MKIQKYSSVFLIGFLTNSVIHGAHFYNVTTLCLITASFACRILYKHHQRRRKAKDMEDSYAAMFPGK